MNIPIRKTVIFSHGKESGPWGVKITRLARVAETQGFEVISIDYRGVHDPEERVGMLLARLQGKRIILPATAAQRPSRQHLKWHRDNRFLGLSVSV